VNDELERVRNEEVVTSFGIGLVGMKKMAENFNQYSQYPVRYLKSGIAFYYHKYEYKAKMVEE
jgi:hypothetical protein